MKYLLLLLVLVSNVCFGSSLFGGGSGSGPSIGGGVSGGLDGSILFVHPDSTLAQDPTLFVYDAVNTRLCIGCPTPSNTFHLLGTARFASLSTGIAHLGATGLLSSSLILNADVSGSAAIAYSKLNLTSSIVNADVSGSAAIAYSKLDLAGSIVNADIGASAGIVDTKLATIATALKVSNSATTAASANTASAIVARDGSGNFTAGTITAALTGNASTATALAANPSDCGVGTKAIAIDASGNLTCSAASLTADVSGVLPIANGGTNKALTLSAGGVPYFDADSFEVLSAGTAGQVIISAGASAPAWGTDVLGVATNSSAAAGYKGQYIESVLGTTSVAFGNGTWGDVTSISLTAGDWDVDGLANFTLNATVSLLNIGMGISVTSGNSATGLVDGSSSLEGQAPPTASYNNGLVISSYRMSLSGTTTVYLKARSAYSSGTPQVTGCRLSARRVR